MASNNVRDQLRGETVRRKKYFYILRPLLAVRWIEQSRGVVPTEFERLVEGVVDDTNLRSEIDELIRIKRVGKEAERGPRFQIIDQFIEAELSRRDQAASVQAGSRTAIDALNEVFQAVLSEDAPGSSGA